MPDGTRGRPVSADRAWFRKAASFAGLALLPRVLWGLCERRDRMPATSARATPATAGPAQGPTDRSGGGERLGESTPLASMDAPNPSVSAVAPTRDKRTSPHECKRAPIRGCAPGKDDFGCYHCTRCWRPFHYDIGNHATLLAFTCLDMPEAPLYVELTAKSGPRDAVQHWLVAATFSGRRFE